MTLHLQHDWRPLAGHAVEIRRYGEFVCAGTVDAVAPDGDILWMAPEGVRVRRLFERSEGYQVWIRYNWEIQRP